MPSAGEKPITGSKDGETAALPEDAKEEGHENWRCERLVRGDGTETQRERVQAHGGCTRQQTAAMRQRDQKENNGLRRCAASDAAQVTQR
jgi:hypothetical protein